MYENESYRIKSKEGASLLNGFQVTSVVELFRSACFSRSSALLCEPAIREPALLCQKEGTGLRWWGSRYRLQNCKLSTGDDGIGDNDVGIGFPHGNINVNH